MEDTSRIFITYAERPEAVVARDSATIKTLCKAPRSYGEGSEPQPYRIHIGMMRFSLKYTRAHAAADRSFDPLVSSHCELTVRVKVLSSHFCSVIRQSDFALFPKPARKKLSPSTPSLNRSHSFSLSHQSSFLAPLRRRIILNHQFDFLLIRCLVLLEQVIRLCLSWALWINLIQKELNTQQNFLDGNGRFPAFFFVEDREADCAGRVDIGVKERRGEFAFWGFGGVFCTGARRGVSDVRWKPVEGQPYRQER